MKNADPVPESGTPGRIGTVKGNAKENATGIGTGSGSVNVIETVSENENVTGIVTGIEGGTVNVNGTGNCSSEIVREIGTVLNGTANVTETATGIERKTKIKHAKTSLTMSRKKSLRRETPKRH